MVQRLTIPVPTATNIAKMSVERTAVKILSATNVANVSARNRRNRLPFAFICDLVLVDQFAHCA
jgi:hypothetical protein